MGAKHGVSTNTPDRVEFGPGMLYANYENGTGTLLGATLGGGGFDLGRTMKAIRPDGAVGDVKGLVRVSEVLPTVTANLMEVTKDNLVRFIAAVNQTAWADGEAVGTADGSTTVFTLDNEADGTIAKIFVDGTEQTSGVTVSGTSVSFTTAPDSDAVITADYTYAGTPSDGDFYELTGDTTIATTDYLTNLAFVLEYTGDSTDGAIFIIDNPLSTGGFSLSIPATQDDVVVYPVTWRGHFDAADLTEEPWHYRLPYNS